MRSPEAPHMAFSPSSGSDEDEDRHAKSSSDELETSRNNRSSDEELPPYPAVGLHQTHVLRTRLPMPPPPAPEVATLATAMEDMVTYVPPPPSLPHPSPPAPGSSSVSTAVMYPSSTSSSLIVKPITLSTSPPSSSSVLAQRPSTEAPKGFPRQRRPLASGQPSRLLPPRTLPNVPRRVEEQQSRLQSPPSPPSPAPAASPTLDAASASSIARPKHHSLAHSGREQQQHLFGIKSSYVQHYNRSPPSSLQHQQHPPPPPPPPPPPLRHAPSTDNPSLSPQRRMDYPNGLSPPPPPTINGDGGRSRSSGGLLERGGGDNADAAAGRNEGNAIARRLPPPRYRQEQHLPRRPLSHQEQQWQHRQRVHPPPPKGGKSLSVENILDEGEASEGELLSPDDPGLNGRLQYRPHFAHQARGIRNGDSVSLQPVSKRSMSNGVPEGRGRSSSPQRLASALEDLGGERDYRNRPASSGNPRRASGGLRMMWQGAQHPQGQQKSGPRLSGQASSPAHRPRLGRASSVESAASKLNDKSRSPSPQEGNLSPPKSNLQSRLRKPLSTSSLPSAHHRAQQHHGMYQQNPQRSSYVNGGGGDHFSRVHQRAKSATTSPGAIRAGSSIASGQQGHVPHSSALMGHPPPPPRQGYGGQQIPQRQQQVRTGFGYQPQPAQHRSQPHLPSSSPSSPHRPPANTNARPSSGGAAGGRNMYSYQQHQTPYQGRPSQMQQPNAAASQLRVPNGGRANGPVGGVGPAAGRHSSVGLPMPGFASAGSRSGQRTM